MQRLKWVTKLAIVATLLPNAQAWSAEHRTFCFSPDFPAWRSFPAPTIDGIIDFPQDKGWAPAFKYVFGNGTPDPDVVIYGYYDNSHIVDMGFTVRNDKTYDPGDTIVLLFETFASIDEAPPSYGELIITPFKQDDPDQSGTPPPGSVHYNTTSNPNDAGPGAQWTSGPVDPPWLKVVRKTTPDSPTSCTSVVPGAKCRWDVEIQIDLSIPGAPNLGRVNTIFVDVVRAENILNGVPTSTEFTWPQDVQKPENNYTFGDFIHFNAGVNGSGTPLTSIWGPAVLGTTTGCNGVWFRGMGAKSDIDTNLGTTFKQNQQVTISAHIHNSSVDGTSGNGIPARGVSATFFHAPFGMTGLNNFIKTTPIPTGGNPRNPTNPVDIAYDGATNLDTTRPGTVLKVDWKPTTACDPQNPTMPCDTGHQCTLVMLNSNDNNTTFVNQAEFQNMQINPASNFDDSAVINVKGLPPPASGPTHRIRLAATKAAQYAYSLDDSAALGDNRVAAASANTPTATLSSQLTWLFHGSRFTGRFLTINNIRHEVWAPVASYGYYVQHPLSAADQKSFEARHADLVAALHDGKPSPELISQINLALLTDQEKPDVSSWKLTTPKPSNAVFVPGTNDQVMELTMPVDSATAVASSAVFDEKSASSGGNSGSYPGGFGCCPGRARGATTPKVGTLGLVVLVGAVLGRRRRRR